MNTKRQPIGFTSSQQKQVVEQPLQNTQFQEPNLYVDCLLNAFRDFVAEESQGKCSTVIRFQEKIKAARLLFPKDKKNMYKIFM